MIDGAFGLLFICDKHIFAVEIQHAKTLRLPMCHGGVAIVHQRVPAGDDVLLHHAGAGHALGGGFHDFEFNNNGIADARDIP